MTESGHRHANADHHAAAASTQPPASSSIDRPSAPASAATVKKAGCRGPSGLDLAQRLGGDPGARRDVGHAAAAARLTQQ